MTIEGFAKAQYNSVKYVYEAVSEPVEGTMLTVLREWAHSLFDFHKKTNDIQELLAYSYEVLESSQKKTKNQLKVILKQYGDFLILAGTMKRQKCTSIRTNPRMCCLKCRPRRR
jgi:hypothetical protein